MAMRYIYRWPEPEDFSLLKPLIPDLDSQLGKPADKLRRFIKVADPSSLVRYSNYTFLTRKKGNDWIWMCTSVELVAEDEAGLFVLTERHKIPRPSHLSHIPTSATTAH